MGLQPQPSSRSKVTQDQVMAAANDDDNPGFCLSCGHEHNGIEPDARNYECEIFGSLQVFGAMEILVQGLV